MTMRAYGLPRQLTLTHYDKADSWEYGFKSRISGVHGSSGLRMNGKRKTRRTWKKRERARNKSMIRTELP